MFVESAKKNLATSQFLQLVVGGAITGISYVVFSRGVDMLATTAAEAARDAFVKSSKK